jgi:hypothetical protein
VVNFMYAMHWACIAWSAAFFGRVPKDVEKVERWFEEYDKVLEEYDEELAPLYKVAKKFTLPMIGKLPLNFKSKIPIIIS